MKKQVEVVAYTEWGAETGKFFVTPEIARAIEALQVVFERLVVKEIPEDDDEDY